LTGHRLGSKKGISKGQSKKMQSKNGLQKKQKRGGGERLQVRGKEGHHCAGNKNRQTNKTMLLRRRKAKWAAKVVLENNNGSRV